jgi:hypothetical protein
MTRGFPETDWKLFRKLQAMALERFCERILAEIAELAAKPDQSAHQRYLAIYKRLHERDDELANAFNDSRRSVALQQLACMQSLGLLTPEELAGFSPPTRESVELLADMRKR